MSEGASPKSAAAIAAAEDSEATASEGSHHDGRAITGSHMSTVTGGAEHARGHKAKPEPVRDLARLAEAALAADHTTHTSAAAHVSTAPGVATPSLSAPLRGAALVTPPTVPGQRGAGEGGLQHVLSGHSAATFLDSTGSLRLQGSSESVGLTGRHSFLSSLDSLLAARQASGPPLGQTLPAAAAPEQLLASLLSALRQQHQQSHQIAEGGLGPPAAAPQPAQLPGGGQLGSIARQLSNTSSLQALLGSVGIRLRTHKKALDESQDPMHLAQQTSTPRGQERVAESQETAAETGSSRRLQRTNSMPIPNPELRRILTGDYSALPPAHSQPQESASVAFQLGQPLPNPFASFANDLLHRQNSSLGSHQPTLLRSALAQPAAAQPQTGLAPRAANSGTASRQSGDGRGRKRKMDAPGEQSAESLPQPNIAQVRRALADALDFTASSKPGLARQRSALQPAVSVPVPVSGALPSDLKRHVGDMQMQVRESMQSGMRSTQSLPPRSSLTANTYMALDAAAHKVSGRVSAEEVQRLVGQAQQQQVAQPQAWGSDGAAEDSEAAREGDPPGDTLDERIKRRRISNRDSARRTRQRRNREMAALREKNEELQAGAEALRAQVAALVDANQALQACMPSDQKLQELAAENAALKAELLELRAAVTQHLAAHASSLPYAQSIALSQVIEQACQQANADQQEGRQ
ncbi:hypothetical protein COCOBI_15-2650 [Coccomyxa sp. Obi]|nr:hypothetical protein COCOBI_15-2650 [Coccomyxa sp. Obi]